MKTVFKNLSVSSVFSGSKSCPWDNSNFGKFGKNHNTVTVRNTETGKRTSFDFWGSIVNPEIKSDYDRLNALYCFVSDSLSGLDSFEDFCYNFGLELDEIKSLNVWKACKRSAEKFFRVSGLSVNEAYDFLNELQEIAG